MQTPAKWTVLLFVSLIVVAGCGEKKSRDSEGAKSEPAPQAAPAPPPEAKPPFEQSPASSESARPEPAPRRPSKEPSPGAAAEPPTVVPGAARPESAPPRDVKPAPTEEPRPAPVQPAESKPAGTSESGAQKPPAKTAPAKDVVVLTGNPLGGVRFEHKLHAARAGNKCATCHHASRPEKPARAPQQACSACHTKVAAAPMKTKYQAAFHAPAAQSGICVDCHKAENAGGRTAPLKCVECHRKENR